MNLTNSLILVLLTKNLPSLNRNKTKQNKVKQEKKNIITEPILNLTNRPLLPLQEILCLRCASLNLLMREEFYHSQYGGPETPTLSAVRTNTATNPRNSSEIHLAITEGRDVKEHFECQNESKI